MHITLIKKTAVVVLSDGSMINKRRVTIKQEALLIDTIKQIGEGVDPSTLEEAIVDAFSSEATKKVKSSAVKQQKALSFVDKVEKGEVEGFSVKRDKESVYLYMDGVANRSMPQFLAEQMALAKGNPDRYRRLQAFWIQLANNPDNHVVEKLFTYLEHNGIKVGTSGMILTFRRAAEQVIETASAEVKYKNATLEQVSELMLQVKKWKKSPKNYQLVRPTKDAPVELYDIKKNEPLRSNKVLGILKNVFDKLQKLQEKSKPDTELRYLANNKTKTKFTVDGAPYEEPVFYSLFKETRLDRTQCDSNPNVECSYGLHLGSPAYVRGNEWLGNKILACLVSPMDVVSIPTSDASKARFSAVYPIAVISPDTLDKFMDSSYEDIDDSEYALKLIDALEARISSSTVAELKQALVLPEHATKTTFMTNITMYRDIVDKRVIKSKTLINKKSNASRTRSSNNASAKRGRSKK